MPLDVDTMDVFTFDSIRRCVEVWAVSTAQRTVLSLSAEIVHFADYKLVLSYKHLARRGAVVFDLANCAGNAFRKFFFFFGLIYDDDQPAKMKKKTSKMRKWLNAHCGTAKLFSFPNGLPSNYYFGSDFECHGGWRNSVNDKLPILSPFFNNYGSINITIHFYF